MRSAQKLTYTKKNFSFDIAIPVLNEENRLESGVRRLIDFLSSASVSKYVVTIADNGSIDETWKIALDLAKEYSQLRCLRVGKKGVGLALKKAWGSSIADIIGYMDVDLSTDLDHFFEVYDIFQNSDILVVNGSRLLPKSKVVNRLFLRTIASVSFNYFLRIILQTRFSDGMCGFKFIRKSAYDTLVSTELYNDGWFFCTELLIKAEWSGFQLYEIPVNWTDDTDSRVNFLALSSYYLREIVKMRIQKNRFLQQIIMTK